jgi:MAE_28990/MAE_18760-like HEPN
VSKPYTEGDLSRQLVEDRTWRIREISDLKAAVLRADSVSQKVLLRALVTICYAHWEGYTRFAARKYLEHVALRRFSFGELDRQFTRNYFLPRLTALAFAKGSFAERCSVIDDILDASSKRFSRIDSDLVNTRSNLSFEVFSEICAVCGVSASDYANQESFIDLILLKRRNAIAHGEDTFIGIEDLDMITTKTVNLMRQFGDTLENHTYLKNYKAAS